MSKNEKNLIIVIGLGYGDEGKGSIVDFLVKKYNAHTIIRFNGGPQAAHHVIDSNCGLHCFSQFGSGMFVSKTTTFLSRFMLVNPLSLKNENEELKKKGVDNGLDRIIIDENCLVVTPFHKIINRMLEISRGDYKHGSCGMGVGQAVLDGKQMNNLALTIGDLRNRSITREKLKFLLTAKVDIAEQLICEQSENKQLSNYLKLLLQKGYINRLTESYNNFSDNINIAHKDYISEIINNKGIIIFEGAQGVLLDVNRGFLPYVTKTDTTPVNAYRLLRDAEYSGNIHTLGVTRAYSTRHGSGPFVTHDPKLTKLISDKHNKFNEWQKEFKIGWLDLISLKYSLDVVNGVDSIALTNIDRLNNFDSVNVCSCYNYKEGENIITNIMVPDKTSCEYQSKLTTILQHCKPIYENIKNEDIIDLIEDRMNTKILIKSIGPKSSDKIQLNPLI